MPLVLVGLPADVKARAERAFDTLKRLARVSELTFADAPPANSAQMIVRGALVALPLEGIIDIGAEKTRLAKEIGKLEGEVKKIDGKLGNADFVARAPEEVVEENRERKADALSRIEKMKAALERLS
jgi:valyl-tRNA synthetase